MNDSQKIITTLGFFCKTAFSLLLVALFSFHFPVSAQFGFSFKHTNPYFSEGVKGLVCADGSFAAVANMDVFVRTDTIVMDCDDCKIPYDTIFSNIITSDIFIVKTDFTGKELWSVQMGNDGNDRCHNIFETPDEGLLLCATDCSYTGSIIKLGKHGSVIWEYRLALHFPKQIISVSDNFLILGTTSHLLNGTDSDIYVQMIDAGGQHIWKKYFGLNGKDNELSGRNNEIFKTACKGTSDNIFIAGMRNNDIVWFDIDSEGNLLATGIIGDEGVDEPVQIALTDDLNYMLLLNYAAIPVLNTQPRLMKISTSGLIKNEIAFFDNRYYDKAVSIGVNSDGSFLITGIQNSNIPSLSVLFNLIVNANGIPQWVENIAYNNEVFCRPANTTLISDNRIFETGTTASGRFTFSQRYVNTSNTNVDYYPVVRTRIDSYKDIGYRIYPNPAENFIIIDADIADFANFSLYYHDGRKALASKIDIFNNTVSLQGVTSGLYIYKISNANINITGKIIIQR